MESKRKNDGSMIVSNGGIVLASAGPATAGIFRSAPFSVDDQRPRYNHSNPFDGYSTSRSLYVNWAFSLAHLVQLVAFLQG